MTTPAKPLPQFGLLTSLQIERQVDYSGYSPEGVEHLAAIDRILRSLVGGRAAGSFAGLELSAAAARATFGGWVMAGSSALHGIYIRPPRRELRAPHELCLAAIGAEALDRDAMAALIAAALPEGRATAVPADPARYVINYTATSGPRSVPLRLEQRPLSLGRTIADLHDDAAVVDPVFLADPRMPYYTGVSVKPLGSSEGTMIGVAYAEEVLLRLFSVLATWPRDPRANPGRADDRAALVDDVRLLASAEFRALADTINGPFRAAIGRGGDEKRRRIAAVVAEQLRTMSAPQLLPEFLRSSNHPYTDVEHRSFVAEVEELFGPLMR